MTGSININANNKSKYRQTVLLDKHGVIQNSDNSLFDTSAFKDKPIGDYFYFLASELPSILASEANKITYNQLQTNQECLPGFYDFVFSKILIEEEVHVLWEIFDYTNVYQEYVKVQQIKNEIDIHEQFLSRQKDLSSSEKNAYSENFFQSEYLENQKYEEENLVYQLIHNRTIRASSSDNQTDKSFDKMLELKGHLELTIQEIDLFLKQVREEEDSEIEVRKLAKDLKKESLSDNLALIFSDSLPTMLCVNKHVLHQLLSLACKHDVNQKKSINASLSFGFQKESHNSILTIDYIEQLSAETDLNDDSARRVIKLSILKSLVSTLGGTLSSKYSSDNHIFGTLISIPLRNC